MTVMVSAGLDLPAATSSNLLLTGAQATNAVLEKPLTFEELEVGGTTYSNVTVRTRNGAYVFIAHSRGLASIKVKDLDDEAREKLGYEVATKSKPPPPEPNLAGIPLPAPIQELQQDPRMQELQAMVAGQALEKLRGAGVAVLVGVLAFLLALYLFQCWCCMLICQKTGNQPGVLVWIPGLQAIPLLKAAGMPAWLFLLLLVPLVNLVISILWCFKIVNARGKSPLVAVLLLLPVTNFFAFLYLAFSNGQKEEEQPADRFQYAA
jgi:hypothetical protein